MIAIDMFRGPPSVTDLFPSMARGGRGFGNWGHWNELVQQDGDADDGGATAVPGQFQIGDNIPWNRVGPRLDRPTTFRRRLEELEHAITLHRDLEIMMWMMVTLRSRAASMSVTSSHWSRALVEIAEFLDDFHYTMSREIQSYLKDIHQGRWQWNNQVGDYELATE